MKQLHVSTVTRSSSGCIRLQFSDTTYSCMNTQIAIFTYIHNRHTWYRILLKGVNINLIKPAKDCMHLYAPAAFTPTQPPENTPGYSVFFRGWKDYVGESNPRPSGLQGSALTSCTTACSLQFCGKIKMERVYSLWQGDRLFYHENRERISVQNLVSTQCNP
jgi:hypothetical protein